MTKFSTAILEQFILFLSVDRGLSQNSISAYYQDITLFLKITSITSPEEISQDSVYLFVEKLHQRNEAESTLARRLIALKVFFRFLKGSQLLSNPPKIDHPKIWKRLPSVLSIEEVDALLQVPRTLQISPAIASRDHAILYTLYSTGIRVSELCGLYISDVSDDYIRITGKGEKTRLVPLGKLASHAIDAYLCSFRECFQKHFPQEPHLFLSIRGKKLERSCVWRRIHYYAKQITHKRVSPHSLRHAFATHLLNNKADLRVIQEMLGHACIASTEIYTHVAADSLIQNFLTYHPRNP
ncbi:Tyrosine recombinase XerD [Chlamydia avium]|uniref:Tyrosine recombinase XerD n=2 Tax=Chlamydia avium TaxID=1457141 RepID=W8JM47_9CHLA|nr:site-specific tyrosine recombinase XerD [Chlamydia avium]AHK63369.1 Tyrosine recombinase XerD [Chlamydia avium 10DC88]EPP37569.1 phage integrase family protein [Chlamydia psittaci 10_743_SC13]EPP38445.1 phage integrase family protein [Chlamydia avium]VVT42970.1 Tyrosine recombinase XerD [Chlamydia avium]